MTPDIDPLKDALEPIRRDFRTSLVAHLATLAAERSGVMATNAVAIERVRRIAHRVRGTAPMLGFAALGASAAAFEDAVKTDPKLAPNLYGAFMTEVEKVATPRG